MCRTDLVVRLRFNWEVPFQIISQNPWSMREDGSIEEYGGTWVEDGKVRMARQGWHGEDGINWREQVNTD